MGDGEEVKCEGKFTRFNLLVSCTSKRRGKVRRPTVESRQLSTAVSECLVRGTGTLGSGGSNAPIPEICLWVKQGILTPTFFGNKYFLVHRSVDSEQHH